MGPSQYSELPPHVMGRGRDEYLPALSQRVRAPSVQALTVRRVPYQVTSNYNSVRDNDEGIINTGLPPCLGRDSSEHEIAAALLVL